MWDDTFGTLLYVDTPEDEERNAEDIVLRMSLLSQLVLFCLAFRSALTSYNNPIIIIEGILEQNYHPTSRIRMSTSVDDLF